MCLIICLSNSKNAIAAFAYIRVMYKNIFIYKQWVQQIRLSEVLFLSFQTEPLVDASVGAAAIFSNSAIDLNGVCYLNNTMNEQVKQEAGDHPEPELVSSILRSLLGILSYHISCYFCSNKLTKVLVIDFQLQHNNQPEVYQKMPYNKIILRFYQDIIFTKRKTTWQRLFLQYQIRCWKFIPLSVIC